MGKGKGGGHRVGLLKQQNKAHKSRFRTKGEINSKNGGAVGSVKGGRISKKQSTKGERRSQKTADLKAELRKKKEAGKGGITIALVGPARHAVLATLRPHFTTFETSTITTRATWGGKKVVILTPHNDELWENFDILKIADVGVFAVDEEIKPFFMRLFDAAKEFPTPTLLTIKNKSKAELASFANTNGLRFQRHFSLGHDPKDTLRKLVVGKPSRKQPTVAVAFEKVQGTMVEGVVVGGKLDPRAPLHLPGIGDMTILRIHLLDNNNAATLYFERSASDDIKPEVNDQMMINDSEMKQESEDEEEMEIKSESESEGDDDDEDWETEEEEDEDEEKREGKLAAMKRKKQALMDEREFPDWVDTPMDRPAKEAFSGFRGMASLRKSVWEDTVGFPPHYASVATFRDAKSVAKRARLNQQQNQLQFLSRDSRVRIELSGWAEGATCGIGLLPRVEGPLTVVDVHVFAAKREIRAGEELVFMLGPRRVKGVPLLSEPGGRNHKMLRLVPEGSSFVASFLAPATLPPAHVSVYSQNLGHTEFVGCGTVAGVGVERIVLERVLLSGFPTRVHKRNATVRFMFFNREDVEFFKPVTLQTRYGRRGNIKSPLGTHGVMKCVFDSELRQDDTVLMALYKRVYPQPLPSSSDDVPKVYSSSLSSSAFQLRPSALFPISE